MKAKIILFFFINLSLACVQGKEKPSDQHAHGIIPAPRSIVEDNEGRNSNIKSIRINFLPDVNISFINSLSEEVKFIVEQDSKTANTILIKDMSMPSEAYRMVIGVDKIEITAGEASGLQYALISLFQMVQFKGFPLPMCTIEDSPSFRYRGMHLDVARHFFTVGEIKKYLDFLAFYKFNHFHWHLTDDQGWRIEIKKYPRLQEVAAYRKETLIGHYSDQPHRFDGVRYGGYYTQEEVKEIVAYAAARHINVVPEIEMPGHAQAALAAYPELGCTGGPYEVATKWGIFDDVFCPNETTFRFLEDVIDEVMPLFPYDYIHIGGDECPKTSWKNSSYCQELIRKNGLKNEEELQSWFIRRMEKYINSKGKKIIGWDEILEGGLAPNATVMSWRGVSGGIQAARSNHDVIMTPGSHCYFDHYQSELQGEPLAIGGFTPISKVYHWNPVPDKLEKEKHRYILGGQANVWTEYIPTFGQVEYMAYARGKAMAEALWGTNTDYNDFLGRFILHHRFLTEKETNVAFHILDLAPLVKAGDGGPVRVRFDTRPGSIIEYTVNGQDQYTALPGEDIVIDRSAAFIFQAKQGNIYGRKLQLDFALHKATNAHIIIDPQPSPKYPANGPGSIVNGISGSSDKYGGTEWLGFEGTDAVITLDFKQKQDFHHIVLRFFKSEGQWIYLPSKTEIYLSDDNINYRKYTEIGKIGADGKMGDVLFDLGTVTARYIRVHAHNYGKIPEGQQGAGHRAWLFVDEIKVY